MLSCRPTITSEFNVLLKGKVLLSNLTLSVMPQVEKNLNDLLLWWEHQNDDDILMLFFDDLLEDHAGCVRRIARFIGVDCDEDTLIRVVHTTTHAEMAHHCKKFYSGAVSIEIAKKFGDTLPPENERVQRVRKNGGRSGDGQQLPAEIQLHIDQLWLKIVTPISLDLAIYMKCMKLCIRNTHISIKE